MFKKIIFILIFIHHTFGEEPMGNIGWATGGNNPPTTEEMISGGLIHEAFNSDLNNNTQWEIPYPNTPWRQNEVNPEVKLEKMDQFFEKYKKEMESSGVTKAALLGYYLDRTNTETIMDQTIKELNEKSGSQNQFAQNESQNNFELTRDFYLKNYPEMYSKIESIERINEKLIQTKDNPQEFVDYYINQTTDEAYVALSLLQNKANIDPTNESLTADLRLKIHQKFQEGMPAESSAYNDMYEIMNGINDIYLGGQLAGAKFEFTKKLVQGLDQSNLYELSRGNEHYENLPCFELYEKKQGRESRLSNNPVPQEYLEMKKNAFLGSLSQSYTYLRSVGIDLDTQCSDGVPYLDRLKDIIANDLAIEDSGYCSLVTEETSHKNGMNGGMNLPAKDPKQMTEVQKRNQLEHLTNQLEGIFNFITDMKVDTSVNCPNGKTIEENISEKIDKVSALSVELNANSNIKFTGTQINFENQNSIGCFTSLENLLEQDLPCDISAVVMKLSDSLSKRDKEIKRAKGKSSTPTNYNEILADRYWHNYPSIVSDDDCYFNMLAKYKENQASFELKIKVKNKKYHVHINSMQLDVMKKYLERLKNHKR